MSNQDTPNIDGWPIASPKGLLIQETPVPAPGVMSNDATNAPGGLPIPGSAPGPFSWFPASSTGR